MTTGPSTSVGGWAGGGPTGMCRSRMASVRSPTEAATLSSSRSGESKVSMATSVRRSSWALLLVESGVLDGYSSLGGEESDGILVFLRELKTALLVCEIEIANGVPFV